MRIRDLNWSQVEALLKHEDRAVLPLGSVEQHAGLSLATDMILGEKVAVEAAEPLGVPVFPVLAYGITPLFMAYPGTVSVEPAHYEALVIDLLESIATHGFRRLLVVNGHGGNRPVRAAAEAWATRRGNVRLQWHDWWSAPETLSKVREIDSVASHASWMESFEWTRIPGATPAAEPKPMIDLKRLTTLDPRQAREYLGDGNFGGRAQREDAEMAIVWETAVAETRARLLHWD